MDSIIDKSTAVLALALCGCTQTQEVPAASDGTLVICMLAALLCGVIIGWAFGSDWE